MNNQDFNTDLFDRYLHHQLNEAELSEFDENLLNDDAFNSAFIEYKTLAFGIRDYGKAELKDFLKVNAKVPVMTYTSKVRKMFYAAAAIVILFAGLTLSINYYIKSNEAPEIAVVPVEKQMEILKDTMDAKLKEELVVNEDQSATVKSEAQTPIQADQEENIEQLNDKDILSEKTLAGVSEDDASQSEDTYKILSDYKISDTLLFALVPMEPNAKNVKNISSEKDNMYKKATPSAANNNYNKNETTIGLDSGMKFKNKNTAIKTEEYTVEFWQSPVNFKGYKMKDKTIQLYGLTNKNIQLFNYNKKIYLRNDSNILSLTPCNDGCTYKTETDATIIYLILNQ